MHVKVSSSRTNQLPEATLEFQHALTQVGLQAEFDSMTRWLYSTDASIYQMLPLGVAWPRNQDDVQAAVHVAAQHKVPLLPRGGGSSLAGQAVGHALVLDFSRYMSNIESVDAERRTALVQPGLTLGQLNRRVARLGLTYAPDPASADRATMGGVIGNNASGAHSIVHGLTLDHVRAVETVLSNGQTARFEAFDPAQWDARAQRPGREGALYQQIHQILQRHQEAIATRYPKTFRSVAGYNLNRLQAQDLPNLTSLVVGSEGSLAIVTRAEIQLVPIVPHRTLVLVQFDEIQTALEAIPDLMRSKPSAIEIIDRMMLDLTRGKRQYADMLSFIHGSPACLLLIEYDGQSEQEAAAGVHRLRALLESAPHQDPILVLSDPAQQAQVWHARKVGLGILMSIPGDSKPIAVVEDAAVPIEHLADYIRQLTDHAQSIGIERVPMYAHASAGCVHVRPMINLKTEDGLRQLRSIAEKSAELVIAVGGTTSGEHGEGLARGEFSRRLFGADLTEAFRQVKGAFDPENLMNPGKVVHVGPMDDPRRLRFGTEYRTPVEPSTTLFQFSSQGGFAQAVEMCNGAGVCRKLDQGVMCPSFMATSDEAHSTRGRANALRTALMGELGEDGLSSPDLYEIMDLCLSCQACYSECPSSVDMAALKAEFLFHYQQVHGVPLRSRLFGNVDRLNRWAQPIAPLANLFLKGPAKKILQAAGVHPERDLPRLARQPFSRWFKTRMKDLEQDDRPPVVFFHDTFVEHNHPAVGRAAVEVMLAAGFNPIILPDRQCCGRPAVSKGLLEEARAKAEHNLRLLAPYARKGIPIVGLEPSCMTMLTHDYPDLVPGDSARQVAQVSHLLDGYLAPLLQRGSVKLKFDGHPRRVLYHGHCQQKAQYGTQSTLMMLSNIANCQVEEIESSCCGMAGSFGYEHEHYDLSIQLAEMSLAPAIRKAKSDTIICASGTSCRDQITHTTGRRALHPMEVLAMALDPSKNSKI
jgi:FAD/FMN-containing dehydrogenase/Fe-S oxidoreductase